MAQRLAKKLRDGSSAWVIISDFILAIFFPAKFRKDYVATSTLKPLEAHRNDLTVFSNLDHELNGGHRAVQGFLTSIKKEESSGFPEKEHLAGPSCC